jgi:hypothetical protein
MTEISSYIKALEMKDYIDPTCASCVREFYPKLERGYKITDIFAPRHKAADSCESGKHNHCTCDVCF